MTKIVINYVNSKFVCTIVLFNAIVILFKIEYHPFPNLFFFDIFSVYQVYNQFIPDIARSRFLRAASTENQISTNDNTKSIERIFSNYSISIKKIIQENKKSLKTILICDKMIINFILLSTTSILEESSRERDLVYGQSLKSMLK